MTFGTRAGSVLSRVFGLVPAAALAAVAADAPRDWPAHRGPHANGTAVDCGAEMVEDLKQAELVWKSEEKTPSAYPINGTAAHAWIQGGYAAPVAAGGRVYLSYWIPNAGASDEAYVAKALADPKAKALGEEVIRRKYGILADDVILCVDAATGKTAWKKVEKERGISFSKQGRGIFISVKGAPRLDPCVSGGKVYVIGCGGHVYALDAGDGRSVWESKLAKVNAAVEAAKAACLKTRSLEPPRVNLSTCPVVADGVLVVEDSDGLQGLDAATGRPLWGPVSGWRNAGGSCPLRWVHKGREYIMAETTCLEARTGKTLWKVEGAVHSDESGCVGLTEDRLVCCGDARRGKAGLQCYKIGPEGATRLWALGPECAAKQFASPVIYRGHIYTRAHAERTPSRMVCVELETGKVVKTAEAPGSCNEVVATDGRVFYEGSYSGPWMYKADPSDFRLLSGQALKDLDFACSVPPAIVDGRMYYRSNTHGLLCLDLRKARAPR